MDDYTDTIFRALPNVNYASIISDWYRYLWGNSYDYFMQFEHTREQARVTPRRVNVLMNNIIDIVEILYSNNNGLTSCPILTELELRISFLQSETDANHRDRYIELGGGAIGTMAILDRLSDLGITERVEGKHYLRQDYRDAIDDIYSLSP